MAVAPAKTSQTIVYDRMGSILDILTVKKKSRESIREQLVDQERWDNQIRAEVLEILKLSTSPVVKYNVGESKIRFNFQPPVLIESKFYGDQPVLVVDFINGFQDNLVIKLMSLPFFLGAQTVVETQTLIITFDTGWLKEYAQDSTKQAQIDNWILSALAEMDGMFKQTGFVHRAIFQKV